MESYPIGEPPNQSESSGSNSDAPIFPNKFRLIAQSYVSSSELSFSKTSSSSSRDDSYEPSNNSSPNPESTSLSSDGVFWDRIVVEGSSGNMTSLPVDRGAALTSKGKGKKKVLVTSSKKGAPNAEDP
jgi:hypothetical protein